MQIEIDQSGKIEYTRVDTVIAYSNHKSKSILIKAKEKRKLHLFYKNTEHKKLFRYKAFACLIFELIKKDLKYINCIIVDQEYEGWDMQIKNYLLQFCRKSNIDFPRNNINVVRIGKKSKAHIKALGTARRTIRPDIIITAKELIPKIGF